MTVVIDGNDIDRLADFWCAVLGFYRRPPVDQFIVLRPTDPEDSRPHLILQQVPEGKVVKNRAHLDLHVPDIAQPLQCGRCRDRHGGGLLEREV